MSDIGEPGLDELERQLDEAFASTRPRAGFADDLGRRLRGRRPWWRRLIASPGAARGGALAAGVVLVLGFFVLVVAPARHLGDTPASRGVTRAPGVTAGAGSLPFGRLPRPPETASGPAATEAPGRPRPAPGSGAPPLPVYRYEIGTGPEAGRLFDPADLPPTASLALYQARTGQQLAEDARTRGGSAEAPSALGPSLAGGRLAYVAVSDPDSSYGYLEPVYVLSDAAGRQMLIPALAPSAYRD